MAPRGSGRPPAGRSRKATDTESGPVDAQADDFVGRTIQDSADVIHAGTQPMSVAPGQTSSSPEDWSVGQPTWVGALGAAQLSRDTRWEESTARDTRARRELASRETPAAADPTILDLQSVRRNHSPRSEPAEDASTTVSLGAPQRFGRYVLLGSYGDGGAAEVRIACQTGPHGFLKPCVLKRLVGEHSRNALTRELFFEEARILGQLAHPNIVRLYEYDEHNALPYIATELVDGVSLSTIKAMMGPRGLPIAIVLRIAVDLLSALEYAHTRGGNIVHDRLSADLVLVSREGDVKLAGFGTAAFESRVGAMQNPPTGDARTDLRALGRLLLELCAGPGAVPVSVGEIELRMRERTVGTLGALRDLAQLLVAMITDDAPRPPRSARDASAAVSSVLARLADRMQLSEFASRHLEPQLPSMEHAIYSLLGRPLDRGKLQPPIDGGQTVQAPASSARKATVRASDRPLSDADADDGHEIAMADTLLRMPRLAAASAVAETAEDESDAYAPTLVRMEVARAAPPSAETTPSARKPAEVPAARSLGAVVAILLATALVGVFVAFAVRGILRFF